MRHVLLSVAMGCGPATIDDLEPTVILVGLDGFRHDYLDRADTPTLDAWAASGVQAESLVPAFPSKSYPNLVTLVTGLYPARHGIVSNNFYDPDVDDTFTYGDEDDLRDAWWWGGEPIWSTVVLAGGRSAVMSWPGSLASWLGALPTIVELPADGSDEAKVEVLLGWLDQPVESRPTFMSLYLNNADNVGHWVGPESGELDEEVGAIDDALGRLREGLEERGIAEQVDLIVVSDHGMTEIDRDRVVFLDDLIDLEGVTVFDWTSTAGIHPPEDEVDQTLAALQDVEHIDCYGHGEAPELWHYTDNVRIPPVLCVAEEGWAITRRTSFEADETLITGGSHGYDPRVSSMHGFFVAHGPHFTGGVTVPAFEGVEVYGLMAAALGLEPASYDGDLDNVSAVFTP